jgi:hypothetical protein
VIDSSVLVAAERGKLDLSQVLERHGDKPVAIAAITRFPPPSFAELVNSTSNLP